MTGVTVGILLVLVCLLGWYLWRKHTYWSSRGVPTPVFIPLFRHIFPTLLAKKRWETVDKMYYSFKKHRYWGMYDFYSPSLYISDPDLIKATFVKDADHFTDRRVFALPDSDAVFREMLTVVNGEKWKSLRSILSPTFTSGKLKAMYSLIEGKAKEFTNYLQDMNTHQGYAEMKEAYGLYTMGVISSCAFGMEMNLMQHPNHPFIKHAKEVMTVKTVVLMKVIFGMLFPRVYNLLGMRFVSEAVDFFVDAISQTLSYRKENNIKRNDFLDLMIEARNSEDAHQKYPFTETTILAQAVLFLLAGYDTTANSLCFVTHLLAKNPRAQAKLRQELKDILKKEGCLPYQAIMEAPYLDACISEALRLYGPAHFLERQCAKDYRLPDTDLVIKEGTYIGVPSYSIQRDPAYWKDPLEFIPERFLLENKEHIVPYTYMPFGYGPRNCIGMRFALMEMKLVLSHLVLEFEITPQRGFEELGLVDGPNVLRPGGHGVRVVLKRHAAHEIVCAA